MNINDIKTVAVIGAGDMGHGIAEVALLAGYQVNLYDIKDEFINTGKQRIFSSLDLLLGKGKIPAELDLAIRGKLLRITTDLEEAVHIRTLFTKQVGLLAPGCNQRKADNVLVELAHGRHICRHVRVVMQSGVNDWFCAH